MGRANLLRSHWAALLVAMVVFGLCWRNLQVAPSDRGLEVVVEVVASHADKVELFFDDGSGYTQRHSLARGVIADAEPQELLFRLPHNVTALKGLRIDPGRSIATMELRSVLLRGPYHHIRWKGEDLQALFVPEHDLKPFAVDAVTHGLLLHSVGPDPYLVSRTDISAYVAEAMSTDRPVIRPFLLAFLFAVLAWVSTRVLQRYTVPVAGSTASADQPSLTTSDILLALVAGAVIGWIAFRATNAIDFVDRALSVRMEITTIRGDDLQGI